MITKWKYKKEAMARQMQERCFYFMVFPLLHTFYRSFICASKSTGILSIGLHLRQTRTAFYALHFCKVPRLKTE